MGIDLQQPGGAAGSFDPPGSAGQRRLRLARVERITPAGSIAKVHLTTTESGQGIYAELSADRFAELQLVPGDRVHVTPRRVRVFVPDLQPEYSI